MTWLLFSIAAPFDELLVVDSIWLLANLAWVYFVLRYSFIFLQEKGLALVGVCDYDSYYLMAELEGLEGIYSLGLEETPYLMRASFYFIFVLNCLRYSFSIFLASFYYILALRVFYYW